jgi:uncharacterized protein (TIGR03118 family)
VQNLVTDDQSVNAAPVTDSDLRNAWGVSYLPTGPFWVSDNASGLSTSYRVVPGTRVTTKIMIGTPSVSGISIPGAGNPTGQAVNIGSQFNQFNNDVFLFVSEDGTISGWRPALGATAETLVLHNDANVYKGVTLANIGSNTYLYAANFRAGTVDVMKGNPSAPGLSGNFTDPNLPSGFAPFNVENIGSEIYVAYAKQKLPDKEDDDAGPGNGFLDRFSLQGEFLARVATGGALNSPWGMVIAPSSFGALAGDLLVGNFGDGKINVFDPKTGKFIGTLTKGDGSDVEIEGLWALIAGNGMNAGSDQEIFFTAGPGDETHGLFGVLFAVPEPRTYALLGVGLISTAFFVRRRRSDRLRVKAFG